MEFKWKEDTIQLYGDFHTQLQPISVHKLQNLINIEVRES